MASDDEQACSSAKRSKPDTTTAADSIQSSNTLFPKIDNLEYFPERVLLNIFSKVNDIDLLHLSDTSCRFEGFAKIEFKVKYASKYFVFDGATDSHRKLYEELFCRLGRYADIKAIEATLIGNTDETLWQTQLVRQYTNQLEKLNLKLKSHLIENTDMINELLSQHIKVEHLILYLCFMEITLPNYRNLKRLELEECHVTFENLAQSIRNNPQLESLILNRCSEFTFYDLMVLLAENFASSEHLTELHVMMVQEDGLPVPVETIDLIVNKLKGLQILKLDTAKEKLELIQPLGLSCKNLKHLTMKTHGRFQGYFSDEMVEAISRFETLESIELSQYDCGDQVKLIVQSLPNLRQLTLSIKKPCSKTSILSLLRKCPALETLRIIIGPSHCNPQLTFFMNLQFFDEFTEIMQKSNAKVEFKEGYGLISYITKKEIIWRNKLIHWIGYDSCHNTSKMNLLDLVKPSETAETHQRSPLDYILNYLDLASLCSMSTVSKQSKQLVDDYVKRHADQSGTFIITDEFLHDANGLVAYAKQVENLKLNICNPHFPAQLNMVTKYYTKLSKLWIGSDMTFYAVLSLNFPQFGHLIVDPLFDFCKIAHSFPNIESLEMKNELNLHGSDSTTPLKFRNLKKFTFKCSNGDMLKKVRKIFGNTSTELIPVYN